MKNFNQVLPEINWGVADSLEEGDLYAFSEEVYQRELNAGIQVEGMGPAEAARYWAFRYCGKLAVIAILKTIKPMLTEDELGIAIKAAKRIAND